MSSQFVLPYDTKPFGTGCSVVYVKPEEEDQENILIQLNEQIDELVQENKELHAQNNRYQVERDELLDENQELKRQIDDLKEILKEMKDKDWLSHTLCIINHNLLK